jgi:hypothetical protein
MKTTKVYASVAPPAFIWERQDQSEAAALQAAARVTEEQRLDPPAHVHAEESADGPGFVYFVCDCPGR